jgi:cation:H+ antiporter
VSVSTAVLIFLGSLSLSVVASIVLARRLEQLGAWLQLSESLLGIIAALGADAPEISSAVTALHAGQHDLGLGIVLGSNIFNLAALLGLSALISGKVKVTRRTLLLNGGVAVGVMAVVSLQLFGILTGLWPLMLVAFIMAPYLTATAISPARVWQLAAKFGLGSAVVQTVADVHQDAKRAETPPQPSRADMLGSIPALVTIVVASIGMVHTAIIIGANWKIPGPVIGTLILAGLTGIPNVVTAIQLAVRRRGSAVLSESLNSNTLNLIAGASIPILVLGLGALSPLAVISLWWMIGMTLLALGLAFVRGGLGRKGGGLLVLIYVGYVLTVILERG